MTYERERAAVMRLKSSLIAQKDTVRRKRWRPSEKAMTISSLNSDIEALESILKMLERMDDGPEPNGPTRTS
jgi:hypothetical protein